MLRELRAAILPTQGLAKTIANWNEIAKRLAESKRARIRQNPEVNAYAGNPYAQLPSYWNQEVSALATTTPEPGALSLMFVGILVSALFAVKSRRRIS